MIQLHLKFMTGLGLVTILVLQSVWLYNTYTLLQADVREKSNVALQKAIDLEVIYRLRQMPNKPTSITGGILEANGKIVNQNLYLQEALIELKQPISLIKLDSIYSNLLNSININTDIALYKVLIDRDSILSSTQKTRLPLWGQVKTEVESIRLDNSEGIQAILLNPYWIIFERMGLLLIATALMVFFVIGCIIYQIRIIAKQYQVAEMRECFSSSMVHDMKSPLSSIHMGIRILESGKIDHKPEVKAQHFQIIKKEIQDLLGLTNKVLTISKMESGKLELDKQEVFLPDMISELADKFTLGSAKSIQFTTNLKVDTVFADEEYLKEAISNLIDNAIKYSKETGQIEIKISSVKKEKEAIIAVRDNGIGISNKDKKLVFEKFERASAAGQTRKGGGQRALDWD